MELRSVSEQWLCLVDRNDKHDHEYCQYIWQHRSAKDCGDGGK